MNKFTKGPWLIDDLTVYAKNNTPHKDNSFWVSVCRGRDDNFERISAAEARANAKLIAAAPDLLEALEGMVSIYAVSTGVNSMACKIEQELTLMARAAIARVRGEV